jgi:hypothetical protein
MIDPPLSSREVYPGGEAHSTFADLLLERLGGRHGIEKCCNIRIVDSLEERAKPGGRPVVQ